MQNYMFFYYHYTIMIWGWTFIIRLKKRVIAIIAFFIGRGLQATIRMDLGVREEIKNWKEGFTIVIETYRKGPKICFVKSGHHLLVKKYNKDMQSDIWIMFKSINAVFETFTGQVGLDRAYAENRMIVRGDLFQTLKVVRMFYACECYLFPKYIWGKIIKDKPKLASNTFTIYAATLLGMK